MSSNPGELPRHDPDEKPQLRLLHRQSLTENQLTENIDWNRDLVEHSRDLLCVHDLDGRFLSVNPVSARLLGYTVEEILEVPMRELLAPKLRDQFDNYLRQLRSAGEATGILAVLTRTGERRLWEYHCTLRTQGVEKPVVHGIAHDVTDRIAAEKALLESNKKLAETAAGQEGLLHELKLFRALLDHSHDAIQVIEPVTLRLLDVNNRTCIDLGYTREELLGMTVYDIAPYFNQESRADLLRQLEQSGFAIVERIHRRKDGTTFPVEMTLREVRLDRNYGIAVARDITDRKLREGRLQEYERVLETLDEMIVVVNRDHRYVLANRAFLRYREMTKEQVVGRHVTEVINRDAHENTIKERLGESFRGQVVDYEMKVTYPRVGERNLAITYLPVEGPTGIDRVAGVLRDITDSKRAAARLEESEKRFRAVHDRAPVGIAVVDSRTGRFVLVNPKYCQIVGRTEREMLHISFRDITHPDDKDRSVGLSMQLLEEKIRDYDVEKRYVRPDGHIVWVNLSAVAMWEPGEHPRWHMAIAQDITERKHSEQALRESEERLRLSQEVAKIGAFDHNLVTGESRWTPPLQAMYRLRPNELPRSVEDFLELIHPDDRAHVSDLVAQSFESGEGGGEWRTRRRDGTVGWISSKWRVFKDASGKPVRVIGSDYDITDRKLVEQELRAAKEKLIGEKLYLEQEIDTQFGFDNIVGQSEALKAVMESVSKVAASDATVLLLGETGTGKELVARAIHRLSRRAGNAFIKMNCAAIPSGLLESELFGHEKGAFTGAVVKKIGRLELADQGTILLDEIGEISLALQPKLLRVLQDQEFERLGGTQTLKIDFRLIAATNCDLAKSVREKKIRSDLYYRLNVFPIFLPPLRERREDIPLLVEHFVQKIARRMNKSITSIPKKTMDALIGWSWPGNVRELENFLERSLILTSGSVLTAPLSELQLAAFVHAKEETLEAAERRHILTALRESRGQISGPRGAATRLGLKRTTLQSKLKQLGINPHAPN